MYVFTVFIILGVRNTDHLHTESWTSPSPRALGPFSCLLLLSDDKARSLRVKAAGSGADKLNKSQDIRGLAETSIGNGALLTTCISTMLPPVDTSLLAANPGFEQLYNSLTTTVLNSDGSTKNDPAAQQREAVREVCH